MPCPSSLRPSCKLPRRKGCSSCSHSFPTDGTPGCSLPQPGPEAFLSSLLHGGQTNCVMGPLPGFCTQTQHLRQQKMLLLAQFFPSCCGWAPGGLGGAAGQSFSGHEVKRVTGCDQDLDTHVELEVVDEEGLRDCANPPGKIIIWQSFSVCGVLDLGISPPPHGYQTPGMLWTLVSSPSVNLPYPWAPPPTVLWKYLVCTIKCCQRFLRNKQISPSSEA